MEDRQNLIYLVIGQIGAGKTETLKDVANKMFLKNPSIKKLVVFDDDDYKNWRTLETIKYPDSSALKVSIIKEENLLRLRSGRVRVIQNKMDFNHYFELFSKLRNTMLVIEDATRFLDPQVKVPAFVKKLFINVKQRNVELFLTFHSLMDVPSFVARNCRAIILHHTMDGRVPKKFTNPNIQRAFDYLKKNESNQYESVFIPVNVNKPK